MKPNARNPFLATILMVAASPSLHADLFDINGTSSGFGVANGGTYDWWAANVWSDTTTVNDGTAAVVTWQGTSGTSEQAYFVGAGAGTNYTVRLGTGGSTDTYVQNIALNVQSGGSAALAGAAGNVTIGNVGDTGKLIIRASNSVGAQNSGTLTINNVVDLNGQTLNYRGGNVVINGSILGSGASHLSSGSAFGLSSGTITLAGDNSFAGNTTVNSGYIFSLQHANALGAAGGTNTVAAGGTMEVAGGVTIASGESIGIAGDGNALFGALRAGTGGGTWAGGVTLNGTGAGPRIGATAGNTLTITGTIANGSGNSFNVSGQSGTGVVVLNPTTSNTYTGTTGIIRGILRLGKTDALPTGTTLDVDSAGSVTDASTFDMAGFSQTVAALQDSATSSINGKITNSVASTVSTLTVNQASNTDFGGVIEDGSGSVVLTKGGAGNLTLSGANTFTGGTNIKNGAIILSAGDNRLATGGSVVLGDVATSGKLVIGTSAVARSQTLAGLTTTGLGGSVVGAHATNHSTLTLDIAAGTNTFDGTLGGAGANENMLALTKTGAGTLKLTGANTYSGPTTLTQGTLQIGVNPVGAITSSAIGTGTLTFNGGTISSDGGTARTIGNAVTFTGNAGLGNATNNGKLTFTNSLDLGGTARTITVNSEVQLDGSFTNSAATSGLTKTGAGTLTINGANTSFGGGTGFSITGGTVVAANTAALGNAGQVVTLSSSGNFGTLDLATDTSANAYVLNFGSVAGAGANVLVNRATSGAAITHSLGSATIGNTKLNVQAGGNVASGTPTLELAGIVLSAGITGDGAATLNPTTAKILVSGNITRTGGSANSLVLDGTSSGNQISGSISGSQTLTKSNASTWELSNANTFTGNTKVTGGTLVLSHNLALQNSAFDTSGAGTLDTTAVNTPTFGGLTSAASYALSANITDLTLNPGTGSTQTYTGNLGGGASGMTLTKTGSGTQILGGTNNYTGLTTVNGGELRITSAGAIGGTDVTVTSGQLALDGGITVSGKSLTTSGSGTNFVGGLQSVNGTNEWAGSVTLGANGARMGARKNATLVVSGSIDDGANTFGVAIRNEEFSGSNNGAGNANTITELSGVSTYGGSTTLIGGVTRLAGGDNRLPTSTILQFGTSNQNAKFDMNGRNQEVAGLAVLNTANDPTRDWNANELTNSSGTLSTLTVNTTSDQTFGLTATSFTGSQNYTGIITGNIALVKSGPASLTLTGANTYTGTTTVDAGSLALGTGGSISASTTIDIKGSATLDVSALAGWALANGQTLAGNGTVEAGGTGNVVTISNGAFLAPGASPGTLLVNGDLSLASGSTFAAEIQTSGSPTADLVNINGNLDIISGALLDLGLFNTDSTLANGSKFSLFSYSGTWSGTFDGFADDSDFTFGLNQFRINYDDTAAGVNGGAYSNYVTLTVVPEPRAALLGALGLLALLRRRRPQAR